MLADDNPRMPAAALDSEPQPLHRRVFFVAGFDPKSPRYYHRLWRELAAKRPPGAEGERLGPPRVGPRRQFQDWADEWDLHWPAAIGEPALRTRFTLLRWDDIVRDHWERPLGTVLRDHWHFYVGGWRQGLLGRAWRLSRLNWVFLMFPLGVALAVLGVWLAFAVALAWWWPAEPGGAAGPVALTMLGLAGAGWAWRHLSHRVGSDWLMRLYGFSHDQAAGRVAALETRVDQMAQAIRQAVADAPAARELLIVGHSTGATLAASALARALRDEPSLGREGPSLGLLSLGHCIPLVYGFDTARVLREELDTLTDHPPLTWVDYTAPADWAGCGRIPPWHRAGRALLHRLSPRFPKILDPSHYQALRRNRLAMHMQYLKPADRAGRYDLLAFVAAGPTLRERHPPAATEDSVEPT